MKSRYMPVIVALLLCVSGCGQLANEQPAPASPALPAETAAPAAVEPVTEASPAEPISSGYIISGTDEYVSLYQQPDSSSTALARLYTGDFIAIYALQGQWYQVKLGDISGYISVDNVSFSKPLLHRLPHSSRSMSRSICNMTYTASHCQSPIRPILPTIPSGMLTAPRSPATFTKRHPPAIRNGMRICCIRAMR